MAAYIGSGKKLTVIKAICKRLRLPAGGYKVLAILIALASGIITIEDRGIESSLEIIGGIISLIIVLYS